MSKVAEKPADKSAEKTVEKKEIPFDQVFAALEQRVEGLSARFRDLVAENARLKSAVIEAAADRDRLKKELEDARKGAQAQGETAERITRLEAEREEVRARIERLLSNLEEAESTGA